MKGNMDMMDHKSSSKKIVIIYHGNCPDGFGGAWAAWKKLRSAAEYIPAEHHMSLPEGLTGKEIYFIDFSYPPEIVEKLLRDNGRVTTIDHHISAEKAVKLTRDYSYALDHSGAILAWEYFHPKERVPKLLEFIEDIDLWRLTLKNSKFVAAIIEILDFNFKTWSAFARDLENSTKRKQIFHDGETIYRYQMKLVMRAVESNAEHVKFAGYQTLAVNSPNFSSEIGNALYVKLPPLGIVWSERHGKIIVSLRSDGTVDVSKLAARYGGGGHKAAAGFSLEAGQPLPWERM